MDNVEKIPECLKISINESIDGRRKLQEDAIKNCLRGVDDCRERIVDPEKAKNLDYVGAWLFWYLEKNEAPKEIQDGLLEIWKAYDWQRWDLLNGTDHWRMRCGDAQR